MSILGGSDIGFLTTSIEVVASVVAAGAVLGGFIGAGRGALGGRSRSEVEGSALWDGFLGGVAGIACLVADLLIRYGGSTMKTRNFYISILVFVGIALPGALLLRPVGGAAVQAIGVVAFIACFTVFHTLDDRDRRHRRTD
jgi:hypothetical protein